MDPEQEGQLQEMVQKLLQEALVPIEKRIKGVEMGGGLTPFHKHNGIDSPQIIIKDLSRVFVKNASWNPPSLDDGQGTTTTVVVPGVSLGDFALATFGESLQGMMLTAYVSALEVVTVVLQNETGGTVNLGSNTLRIMVIRKQS